MKKLLLLFILNTAITMQSQDTTGVKNSRAFRANYYKFGITTWGGMGVSSMGFGLLAGGEIAHAKYVIGGVVGTGGSIFGDWASHYTGFFGWRKSGKKYSVSFNAGAGVFVAEEATGGIFNLHYKKTAYPCADLSLKGSREIRGNGVGLMAYLNINPKMPYLSLTAFVQLGWKWNTKSKLPSGLK